VSDVRLTLVSASPRRAELLRKLALPYDVRPSAAAEYWTAESPAQLAMDNARHKVERSPLYGDRSRVLIGADTIIACDNRLFGKPAGRESAMRILQFLSGRKHEVITGVCVSGPNAEAALPFINVSDAAVSSVHFHELSAAQLREYVESGEWEGKAGAYAIQGLAAGFVSELIGDYQNVVGLPVELIHGLLREKFIHCRFL
jgi:septum formation protein